MRIFIVILVLAGCGNDGKIIHHEKPLFSIWAAQTTILNLAGLSFGVPSPYTVLRPDGSTCECIIWVEGSENQGIITLNNCKEIAAPTDLACSAHNNTASYVKDINRLTVHPSSGPPLTYH